MPQRLRLSLVAALWGALWLLPAAGQAVPDMEKLTLSGASSMTAQPMAVATYPQLGLILTANRGSDTVSVFELPALGPVLDPGDDLNPLTLDVVDDPVAIAVWDNATQAQPIPTKAYAFVAGFAAHAISVIDLLAEPPAVLTAREINLVPDSEGGVPGPVALTTFEGELIVATNGDGTAMRYDITDLPGATPAHISFPVASTDRTSAKGNAIICQALGNVTPGARPRALLSFGDALWAGCDNGAVSQFFIDGEVTLITTSGGPTSVAALAGDTRSNTPIVYILADDVNGVFAMDFTDPGDGPLFINQICAVGGAARSSIPITTTANSTAMISYRDPSDETNWLLVLSTAAAGSFLEAINVANIDSDGEALPECGIDATDGISFRVPLTLGNTNFPSGTTPPGISQQIGAIDSYIAIPNFGATSGANLASLVTDAALLTASGTIIPAMTSVDSPAADPMVNTAVTAADLLFTSDEDLEGTEIAAFARIKGELSGMGILPQSFTYAMPNATVVITSGEIATKLSLLATDNEAIEIQLAIPDDSGDYAFTSREIIYDTTPPMDPSTDPELLVVQEGSNTLRVTVVGATDVIANNVMSGLGGFYVEFTDAEDENGGPVTVPDPRNIASTTSVFDLVLLENRTTYKFNIYVLDRAGNRSVGFAMGEGTPVPGISILDLVGEAGCVFSPRSAGGAGWLLLGAAFIAYRVRRRGARR